MENVLWDVNRSHSAHALLALLLLLQQLPLTAHVAAVALGQHIFPECLQDSGKILWDLNISPLLLLQQIAHMSLHIQPTEACHKEVKRSVYWALRSEAKRSNGTFSSARAAF